MPLAIIRADATQISGGGHVMRCISLANVMANDGWDILFCGVPQTPDIVPALKQTVHCWQSLEKVDDARELSSHISDSCDVLIVDHYGLDGTFEHACRGFAKRIFVVDDLADRPHDCDVLLDQTFGRSSEDYATLTPKHCHILTGPNFALLRPQFADARECSLARRNRDTTPANVLISFGATDSHNLTKRTLLALEKADFHGQANVILGKQAPHLESVRAATARLSFDVAIHSDVEDMATLMVQADLAIGAGGTTSWERCCVGLPSIVVVVADNQNLITNELEKVGAVASVGWHESATVNSIAQQVAAFLSNPQRLKTMSDQAALVCDGLGTQRTYQALTS